MPEPLSPEPKIIIVPGSSLPSQRWWKALHLTINTSFQNKDFQAFPPSWTRLDDNPKLAAEKLAQELGPDGHIAVVLLIDRPIACGGVLPFRGPNWIENVESANDADDRDDTNKNGTHSVDVDKVIPNLSALPNPNSQEDWEICCFCVHPMHRSRGLSVQILQALVDFVKQRGAKRLLSNYAYEETGEYWPKMGFQTVKGAGGVLKKGYTHTPGKPGLKADIHFRMGSKAI